MYNLADSLRIIATLLKPFLSHTVERISEQMNFGKLNWHEASSFGKTKAGTDVHKMENLFPKT